MKNVTITTNTSKTVNELLAKKLRHKLTPFQGWRIYSPQDWQDRGEKYGTGSELIITYEGSTAAPFFSLDKSYDISNYAMYEEMRKFLADLGYYSEEGTKWFSVVYKS